MAKDKAQKQQAPATIEDDEEIVEQKTEVATVEENLSSPISANSRDADAIAMGAILVNSEVSETLKSYADAKHATTTIPFRLWFQIVDALAENDMDETFLPLVGTDEKTCGNRKPEVWAIPTVKANGEKGTVKHRFFNVMFGQTPDGKAMRAEMAAIEKSEPNMKIREQRIATINTNFNNRVEALRKAVRLGQKMAYVKETFPSLDVRVLADKDEKGEMVFYDVMKPILVCDKSDPAKAETLGPKQFQTIKWEDVQKDGGTFLAFRKHVERKPRRGVKNQQTGSAVKLTITTLTQLHSYLAAIANVGDDEALLTKLIAEANKDEAAVDIIGAAYVSILRLYAGVEAKLIALQTLRKQAEAKAKAANA